MRLGPILCAALLLASPAVAHESASARLDALSLAITLDPSDGDALLGRADEHRRLGRLDDAEADLAAARRHGVEPASVALQSALIALARGHKQEAAEILEPFATLASAPIQDARADAHGGRDDEVACAARLSALAAAPDTPRALHASRDCASAPASLVQGLAAAEATLGLVPQIREARIRATAVVDPAAAIALADELVAVRSAPSALLLRAELHDTRGAAGAAHADRVAALALAESRLARRDTPLRRLALAEAQVALSRFDAARAQLAEVLRDAPDLLAARSLLAELERR